MTRKYKSSYKSRRGVKRFAVELTHTPTEPHIETCTMCGGKVEESPMMRGICYGCYRSIAASDIKKQPAEESSETPEFGSPEWFASIPEEAV